MKLKQVPFIFQMPSASFPDSRQTCERLPDFVDFGPGPVLLEPSEALIFALSLY